MTIYVINGPNLNLLGTREPEIYGRESLSEIEQACVKSAETLKIELNFCQSNHEGTLIDWVQEAGKKGTGVIVNPGGLTHTSVALRDALASIAIPKIELHLSNPHTREEFRQKSYVSGVVDGIICGFGGSGYLLALDALARLIDKRS